MTSTANLVLSISKTFLAVLSIRAVRQFAINTSLIHNYSFTVLSVQVPLFLQFKFRLCCVIIYLSFYFDFVKRLIKELKLHSNHKI